MSCGEDEPAIERRGLPRPHPIGTRCARRRGDRFSGEQPAALRSLKFEVADLPGWYHNRPHPDFAADFSGLASAITIKTPQLASRGSSR